MSVPYAPPGYVDILSALDKLGITDFYLQYFQKPGVAEAELQRDIEGALRRIYFTASGDLEEKGKGFARLTSGTLLGNTVDPPALPAWLSEADLDYYAGEFRRTGFRGGLSWYRNLRRNWELAAPWRGQPVRQPSLFLAGSRDGVLRFPAAQAQLDAFPRTLPGLRASHILEGAGHWVQQERPAEVNKLLIDFLKGLSFSSVDNCREDVDACSAEAPVRDCRPAGPGGVREARNVRRDAARPRRARPVARTGAGLAQCHHGGLGVGRPGQRHAVALAGEPGRDRADPGADAESRRPRRNPDPPLPPRRRPADAQPSLRRLRHDRDGADRLPADGRGDRHRGVLLGAHDARHGHPGRRHHQRHAASDRRRACRARQPARARAGALRAARAAAWRTRAAAVTPSRRI